ncbi:MAG: hypothetical protein V3T99_05205 [Nitrososphaerales archaeon]
MIQARNGIKIGLPIAVAVLLWSTLFMVPLAFSQEERSGDVEVDRERQVRQRTRASVEVDSDYTFRLNGHGVAVNSGDEAYRSRIGLAGMIQPSIDAVDADNTEITITRGALWISSEDGRMIFNIDPESCTAKAGEGDLSIECEMTDGEENSYKLAIRGTQLGHTSRRVVFLLQGTLTGETNDRSFDLTYIATVWRA